MNQALQSLYEATSDDLRYGIGVMRETAPGQEESVTPTIATLYPHWSREQLELVRGACTDGLTLTVTCNAGQARHIHLATRQVVTVSLRRGGETDVLRAPAWDARLEGIETAALEAFLRGRQACGGFLLLMQTARWEFTVGVDDLDNGTAIGPITPRTVTVPSPGAGER